MEVASIDNVATLLVLDDDSEVEVGDILLCDIELMDVSARVASTLSTNLTGTNNDLVFTAVDDGSAGDDITITYVDPGGTTATLGVVVTGTDIVVNLGRAASAINTTGDLLKAAIEGSVAASALVTVADKAANDGSGLVTALTETPLAGGGLTVDRGNYGTTAASHSSDPVYKVDRLQRVARGVEVYYFGDPDADTFETENFISIVTGGGFVTSLNTADEVTGYDEDNIVAGELVVHYDGVVTLTYKGKQFDGDDLAGTETLDLV